MTRVEKLNDTINQMTQQTAGKIAVAIGGGGTLLQAWTEYASLLASTGNLILVAGGLYLMWHKIKDRRRIRRNNDGIKTTPE